MTKTEQRVENTERLLTAVANKLKVAPNVVYRVPDLELRSELKSLFATAAEEEAIVNIRPRYRGFMKGNYLVGHKRTGTGTAKRITKILIERGLI